MSGSESSEGIQVIVIEEDLGSGLTAPLGFEGIAVMSRPHPDGGTEITVDDTTTRKRLVEILTQKGFTVKLDEQEA